MRTLFMFALALITAQCLIAGAASADSIVVPESWAGVWETTTTERDCETLEILSVTTSVDTLCAGDTFDFEDPDGGFPDLVCDGTITDTTLHMECSGSMEVFPGCTVTFNFVSDATRNGETTEGVTVITTTFDGSCFSDDLCFRNESTSVRLGEDPDCGPTPVDSQSWGTLKSTYR